MQTPSTVSHVAALQLSTVGSTVAVQVGPQIWVVGLQLGSLCPPGLQSVSALQALGGGLVPAAAGTGGGLMHQPLFGSQTLQSVVGGSQALPLLQSALVRHGSQIPAMQGAPRQSSLLTQATPVLFPTVSLPERDRQTCMARSHWLGLLAVACSQKKHTADGAHVPGDPLPR